MVKLVWRVLFETSLAPWTFEENQQSDQIAQYI